MKRYTSLIVAAVLAILLGAGVILRSRMHRRSFDRTVHDALKTSEGYDQKFIDMVNRLEDILAHRASFGYTGGKDPMTGKLRTVVKTAAPAPRSQSGQQAQTQEAVDPFKLTAIIYDDAAKKFTAVIMVEERSYSVDPGEVVAGRKIQNITNERVYMEDDSMFYYYDISGRKGRKSKAEPPQPAVAPQTAPRPAVPAQAPKAQ